MRDDPDGWHILDDTGEDQPRRSAIASIGARLDRLIRRS
jgi:hypothetical protein